MTFAYLGLRMGNGQAYSQLLELGMGIENLIPNFWDWEWEYKNLILTFLDKLSLFKVNFTQNTKKGCIETTMFPNKVPNIFL